MCGVHPPVVRKWYTDYTKDLLNSTVLAEKIASKIAQMDLRFENGELCSGAPLQGHLVKIVENIQQFHKV